MNRNAHFLRSGMGLSIVMCNAWLTRSAAQQVYRWQPCSSTEAGSAYRESWCLPTPAQLGLGDAGKPTEGHVIWRDTGPEQH